MDTVTVEVRNRFVGGSRGDAPVPVQLELETDRVTAAELIRLAVAEQIRELQVNRGLGPDEIHRILARQYLTHDGPLGRSDAIDAVLQGFTERAYVMLVNGRQVDDLADVVTLQPSNRVTFFRLMAFSGG